ncbi:MAG: hypothetical protein SCK57_01090 [Bacillota bacterium]|nr:hypothetical protein [Bacillota bacterium]MDW7676238.1 hypothetical protein [Bacillota bacterium]
MKGILAFFIVLMVLLSGCATDDVTSYELRQPLKPGAETLGRGYIMWLPVLDNTFLVVEAEGTNLNGSESEIIRDVVSLYLNRMRQEKGLVQLPDELMLLSITLEEIHTARHYNRTWVLEFNEALLNMPETQQRHFLAGLTKTLIEGNQHTRHQTNFTSTRILAGETAVGSFNVFHT